MKTIQVQLAITLDETAAKSLAELLSPATKQAAALPVNEFDERKSARLCQSRNAIFGDETSPHDQGLLIDSRKAARLLKVSTRTLWRMHTTGEMPAPIRIRRAVRWNVEVLRKVGRSRMPC